MHYTYVTHTHREINGLTFINRHILNVLLRTGRQLVLITIIRLVHTQEMRALINAIGIVVLVADVREIV